MYANERESKALAGHGPQINAYKKRIVRVHLWLRIPFLFASCRAEGLAKADLFPDTELAENPAKQIFGVVTPDHIANRVKGAAELD
jgi:hypothetical protein